FILFLISESFAQYTDNFEQWSKKVAITLVGRMPTVEEHEYFKKINSEKNYDSIKQEKIIDYFIKLKDFNMYLSIQFREELLEGVDREELTQQITYFYFLSSTREYSIMLPVFQRTFEKLNRIGILLLGMNTDTLKTREIQRMMVDNYIYSQ